MKYNKCAIFSDIHYGRKNNSIEHNEDCNAFIDWFIDLVKKDKTIDHIIFMGDWHESRNSIAGLTLMYSILGAEKLNSLGLPVYFIVGNHDLYYRNNREVFTPIIFKGFENIKLISDITSFTELDRALFVPYLFEDEYKNLYSKIKNKDFIFSHLEYKNFVMTGDYKLSEKGLEPSDFKNISHIFCGHFHKRQSLNNIHYIGNTFQMDFSDTDDLQRGCTTFNYDTQEIKYFNYDNGPRYKKIKMSELDDNLPNLTSKTHLIVSDDLNMDYDFIFKLNEKLYGKYNIRNLKIEAEAVDIEQEHLDEDVDINQNTDESIRTLLEKNIEISNIDNKKLIEIYNKIIL